MNPDSGCERPHALHPADAFFDQSSTEQEPRWTSLPTSAQEFASRLREVGLGTHADALVALVRTASRLVPTPQAVDTESAPCRLGGRPLLPHTVEWPRTQAGKPLSFVAQIALSQVGGVEEAGVLSFFYDAVDQAAWGFEPDDHQYWAVIHTPDGAGQLRDLPDDLDEYGHFAPVALTPQAEVTFPPYGSYDVEVVLGEHGIDPYFPVLYCEDNPTVHRYGGHPHLIQGDIQLECQLASNGINVGGADWASLPEVAQLRPGASQWKLLLQVDSCNVNPHMMWGDSGRLYFMIRNDDLAAQRWEKVWMVLQCY